MYDKHEPVKKEMRWVYEIMQKRGGIRKFYFKDIRKLNKFATLTREHSKDFIMPDMTDEIHGIRDSVYSTWVNVLSPYCPPINVLQYYGCNDDNIFFENEKYWNQVSENVEKKRLDGVIPPNYVNMTDWVKMSKKQKKEITDAYKLKR